MASVSAFLDRNFRHFNARETLEAARAFKSHLAKNGRILLAMGGAMSTAELGVSLAKMIRAGKIHAISSTAANLEEDLFGLLARNEYVVLPDYRHLSPEDDLRLRDQGFNRVTDTCIPESVIGLLEEHLVPLWAEAASKDRPLFPYEFIYRLIDDGFFDQRCCIPKEESWVLAAHEMQIPIYTPGFEDSSLGNILTANVMCGAVESHSAVRTGTMQFEHLIRWYKDNNTEHPMGFFQIGGGIAGDFAICCVPSILQDLREQCRLWSYFAQISDAVTSYGSYSGAPPNEKITWHKLDKEAAAFMINSDATIVAPLIFAYVLGE